MSEIDESANNLSEIGWSQYESKTFAALTIMGSATAAQISKKSGIPNNRVYQVLEKLIAKGFVKRIAAMGLTTRYEVQDITNMLNQEIEDKKQLYNKAIASLDVLKERQSSEETIKTYTIFGSQELAKQLEELIEKATNEVFFFVDTLVELRKGNLLEVLNEKAEDLDIEIKLMTTPRGINDIYEKEVYKELVDIDLRVTDDTLSTILLIIDDVELVFVSYAQLTEESMPRDYFGVYLQDRRTVRMFLRIFNLAWELATFPDIE